MRSRRSSKAARRLSWASLSGWLHFVWLPVSLLLAGCWVRSPWALVLRVWCRRYRDCDGKPVSTTETRTAGRAITSNGSASGCRTVDCAGHRLSSAAVPGTSGGVARNATATRSITFAPTSGHCGRYRTAADHHPGTLVRLSQAPKQLTVHVPPDLRSGATLAIDEVPAANVYALLSTSFSSSTGGEDGAKDYGKAIFRSRPT